jgi:pyrroloquinoline quinone biosynthesis protein B
MRVRVLGSAAGGGFPQWNCGCGNCRGVREGTIKAIPRMQDSITVSADGEGWFLLNASPEIRAQIESFPGLQPRRPRHSPIEAIVLTNGDLDHCLGIFSLREAHPIVIYATDHVRQGITRSNVFYRTLQRFPGQVTWHALKPGREDDLLRADGRPSGLTVQPIPAPGKLPVHLEGLSSPDPEDNVGLKIRDRASGKALGYFSAIGKLSSTVLQAFDGLSCLFFDGTFWSGDELSGPGYMAKTAEDLAHLPIGGPGGSLEALASLNVPRRVYIHINNTNPILREDSLERRAVEAAGCEVAFDGMELTL